MNYVEMEDKRLDISLLRVQVTGREEYRSEMQKQARSSIIYPQKKRKKKKVTKD